MCLDNAVSARLLDIMIQVFATCAKARLSELIRVMQIAMKLVWFAYIRNMRLCILLSIDIRWHA